MRQRLEGTGGSATGRLFLLFLVEGAVPYTYPPGWSELKYPWIRAELFAYLDELADPGQTAKWRAPDGVTMCGSDFVFHFFFDDHDFDEGDIGWMLLGQAEADIIAQLKQALSVVYDEAKASWQGAKLAPHEEDAFLLDHVLWENVVNAAAAARDLLSKNGRAIWQND